MDTAMVSTSAQVVVGLVFLASAIAKTGQHAKFGATIRELTALPNSLARLIGKGVIVLELVIAVLLLIEVFERFALLAAGMVLVVFTATQLVNAFRSNPLECYCFGSSGGDQVQPRKSLMRTLLVFVAWVIAAGVGVSNPERSGWPGAHILGVGVFMLGYWSLWLPDVFILHRQVDRDARISSRTFSLKDSPMVPVTVSEKKPS